MKNIWKRSLSLFLAVVMVVGMVPMNVFATEECTHEATTIVEEPASCTEDGCNTEVCDSCGETLCVEEIAASGHSYVDGACENCGEADPDAVAEEEPAEEAEEEPAEEAEEETSEEADAQTDEDELTMTLVEVDAAMAEDSAESTNAADGIIWLDKNRDADLLTAVMDGKLRDMVLQAVGMSNYTGAVYYNSESGQKNVASLLDLMDMYEELKDVLTGSTTMYFTIDGDVYAVRLLNILNLDITVSVEDVAAAYDEKPANIGEAVKAKLDAAVITATYNDVEVIDWKDLVEKGQCKVEYITAEEYAWPDKTECDEDVAEIIVTVYDSVDGSTKVSDSDTVDLVDNTPIYSIIFMNQSAVHASYAVIKGKNLTTTHKDPSRRYYTFGGWDKDIVTASIDADATYTAKWNPIKDSDGDGTADEEERYNIIYLVDGNVYEEFNANYGVKTPKPETDPTAEDKTFLGWVPENEPNGLVDETVTRNRTYVPSWQGEDAEEFLVTYTLNRIGADDLTFKMMTADKKAPEMDLSGSYAFFSGWKTEGNTEFNFETELTENLTLYAEAGYDENSNNIADGSAGDPYTIYYFLHENGNVDSYIWFQNDKNSEKPDLTKYGHIDTYMDERIHTGWAEYSKKAVDTDSEKYTEIELKPTFADDVNNNTVLDEAETARVSVTGEGTVSVNGKEGEQTFLYNSKFLEIIDGDKNYVENNVKTVLVATPKSNYYVSAVKVNDVAVSLEVGEAVSYNKGNGSYTICLTDMSLEADSDDAAGVEYDVEVVFTKLAIDFKDDVTLTAGTEYSDEALYNEIVETPVYNADNGDSVTMEYLAREAQTNVKVDVSALRKDIERRYGKVGKLLINAVWPSDTITVNLTKVTRDINEAPAVMQTIEQVVDSYIREMQTQDVTSLAANLAMLESVLQYRLNNEAEIRSFLYEAGTETITATIVQNGNTITATETFAVTDERTDVTIAANDKTLKAGAFDDNDVLANVTASNDANVYLLGSYEDCAVGTYDVTVYTLGTKEYKPEQATFQLTVETNAVTIEMPNVVAEEGTGYNAAPKVNPEGVDLIQIVAGIELDGINLDLSAANPYANLNNIQAKALVKMPESVKSLMTWLGEDLSEDWTLSELKEKVEYYQGVLEEYGIAFEKMQKAINALEKVESWGVYNYADASGELIVSFTDNIYPETAGVYANIAVSADPSYETAYAYGYLLIAPVTTLPDRNGLQLTYGGVAENIFELVSDGSEKALTPELNGSVVDAPVYYYGLTAELSIHASEEAPTLPGVYLASSIYPIGDSGKMASDSALMMVDITHVDLDVDAFTSETYDGTTAYKPDVTVTKDGKTVNDAAITMISGTVQNDDDLSLDNLGASVNISFPEAVHTAWTKFAEYMNSSQGCSLNTEMEKAEVSAETFAKFVNWLDEKLNTDYTNTIKAELAAFEVIPEKYINKTVNIYNQYIDNLQDVSGKLVTASQKLAAKAGEETMVITFHQDYSYTEAGVYLYYGMVTDPNYVALPDAGVMVIKDADDALVLLDTTVPYDGKQHEPVGWNDSARDAITFVLDRENKTVNLLTEDTMAAVIKKFEEETGKTLSGMTFEALYEKAKDGVTYAEKLVEEICNAIEEKAISKIKSETGNEIADATKTLLDEKLGELKTELTGKLDEYKDIKATFYIDNALPKEVGSYEFYSYGYSIEWAYAALTIEPIHVRLSAGEHEEVYNGGNAYTVSPERSYFSYKQIEGGERTEVAINTLPSGMTAPTLDNDYKVQFLDENGKVITSDVMNAATYDITITNVADIDTDTYKNFADKVDVVPGTLEITPRPITVVVGENIKTDAEGNVTAVAYTKYYGDVDPDFNCKIYPDDQVAVKDGLVFTAVRSEKGENVNAEGYKVTAYLSDANDTELANNNYEVKYVNSTLTIKPAEITITIGNEDKCFDEEDPSSYRDDDDVIEVVKGLSAENLTELIGKTKDEFIASLNVIIKRGDEISGNGDDKDEVGETFKLIAEYAKNDNVTVTVTSTNETGTDEDGNTLYADYGILTITLGDYICWNTATKVYYDDVTDALKAAEAGQTVQMLADATADNNKDEETIIVYNGLTFDLNGYYVETDNLLSFGVVMDSMGGTDSIVDDSYVAGYAEDGSEVTASLASGGVVIDVDTTKAWTMLQTENGDYIPVYDTVTGSYKFFKELPEDAVDKADGIAIDSYAIGKKSNSTMVQFGIRLLFENREAYMILNRTTKSGLSVVMDIDWTGVEAFTKIEYKMSDGLVASHAGNQYNDADLNMLMVLTINGLQNVGSGNYISAVPRVETTAGVTAIAEKDDDTQHYIIKPVD